MLQNCFKPRIFSRPSETSSAVPNPKTEAKVKLYLQGLSAFGTVSASHSNLTQTEGMFSDQIQLAPFIG